MAKQLAIGQLLHLDWNTAKVMGDEAVAYDDEGGAVRVEAVGVDWLVVRLACGLPMSATFDSPEQFENFLDNLGIN